MTSELPFLGKPLPTGWGIACLGDIVAPVTRSVAEPPSNVLTISSTRGFVPQGERWGRFMAGKSLAKYVMLQRGEFAYNRGNSLSYPRGCVFRLMDCDCAAVPFVYFCFRASSPSAEPEFLDHYFRAGGLNAQLGRIISTGVRNNGLLNIREKDFYKVQVPLPPLREQRQIAMTLQAADDAVATGEAVVEQLDHVRRALADDLLAGAGRSAESTIGDVVAEGPRNGLYKPADKIGRGALIAGMTAIQDEGIDWRLCRRAEATPDDLSRFGLHQDDILVTRVYARVDGVGRFVLVSEPPEPAVYESNMMRIRVRRDRVLPGYVAAAMASRQGRQQIEQRATLAAQASLNSDSLRSIRLPVPSLEAQGRIVTGLSAVTDRIHKERAVVAERRRIKAALADALLKGKIRVPVQDRV